MPALAPPPKRTLEEELLGLLNLASFEQAEADAESRMKGGLTPGWFREIRNATGTIIDLRPRSYSSLVEAGIDYLVAQVADPATAIQARFLQPLARRYVLRRERLALVDVAVPEPRTQRQDRASVAERTLTERADWSESGNRRAMIHQRLAAEQDARDFQAQQFNERQKHLIGDEAPDPNNPAVARVRIDAALRQWNVEHPELVEALVLEHA